MAKILKESNRFLRSLVSFLHITPQLERLIVSFIAIVYFVHISACAWKFILDFTSNDPNNWLIKNGFVDVNDNYIATPLDVYVACSYLIVQTIITVGYGDLPPGTTSERISACFWMFVGVFLYSFTIGSLASLISDKEITNARFNKKHTTLINLKKEYKFGNKLYFRLKRALKFGIKITQDNSEFLQDLPQNIRLDLAYIIHRDIVDTIPLFQDKPKSFIAFIGPLLRPMKMMKGEYIFYEGDPADEIFFIRTGVVSYVLPKKYQGFRFLKIREGYFFGEMDLLFYGEMRKYSALAIKDCDFYVLNKKDFKNVFLMEFRDIGEEIIENAYSRKIRTKKVYKEAIQYIESKQKEGLSIQHLRKNFNRMTIFDHQNSLLEMLHREKEEKSSSLFEEDDEEAENKSESKGSDKKQTSFEKELENGLTIDNRNNDLGTSRLENENKHDENSLPKTETALPKSETALPKSETALPKSEMALPKSEIILPQSETALPKSQTALPNSLNVLNKSQTIFPKSPTIFPKSPKLLKSQTVLPKSQTEFSLNDGNDKEEMKSPLAGEDKKAEGKEEDWKPGDKEPFSKRSEGVRFEESTTSPTTSKDPKRKSRRRGIVGTLGPESFKKNGIVPRPALLSKNLSLTTHLREGDIVVNGKEMSTLASKVNTMQNQLTSLLNFTLDLKETFDLVPKKKMVRLAVPETKLSNPSHAPIRRAETTKNTGDDPKGLSTDLKDKRRGTAPVSIVIKSALSKNPRSPPVQSPVTASDIQVKDLESDCNSAELMNPSSSKKTNKMPTLEEESSSSDDSSDDSEDS